jgi:hypothetical protein
MGGLSSGYWYRWNSKATVGSQDKIDIRVLSKLGLLHQGIVLDFSRTSRGENCGLISLRVETDRLVLIYRNLQKGGAFEQIKDEIFFDWTPCNYGGYRQCFLCPRCKRRVAVIYRRKYYRCRHCYNLTYYSQQESKSDRLMRKAKKIRIRLGASQNLTVPVLLKPKYMHQKTFDRLRKETDDASNRLLIIIGKTLRIVE